MKIALIGRIAGALALTMGLAGCIDMTMDLKVTSDTTAVATTTQTMGADIYAMIKSAGDQASTEDEFCTKDGETLTENADGSATCVSVSEGEFAKLSLDEGDSKPTFTLVSPGVVRVAVATKDMAGDLGKEEDPQTAEMMKQLFEGHFLTIRFGGVEVIESNMTISDDKTSAEIKIPFLELMDGSAKLPEELYAVVKTN
jgi:hypothetical protein